MKLPMSAVTDEQREQVAFRVMQGLWAYSSQRDTEEKCLTRERFNQIRQMNDYSPFNGQVEAVMARLSANDLIRWPRTDAVTAQTTDMEQK